MYNAQPNSLALRYPKCGNCRHLEPAPLRGKGWCRNPRLYPSHFRHLVEISSLDCDSKYHSRKYWEPIPAKNVVEKDEEAEEVLEYVHPLITRGSPKLLAEADNPIIGDLGEQTVELFSYAPQEQPVWTDPGIYGYQKPGTPIKQQTLATLATTATIEKPHYNNNYANQIWRQKYLSQLEQFRLPKNLTKNWLPFAALGFLLFCFLLSRIQGSTDSTNAADSSNFAVTQVASEPTALATFSNFDDATAATTSPSSNSAVTTAPIEATIATTTSAPIANAKPAPTATHIPAATATALATPTPTSATKTGVVSNVTTAIYLRKDPVLGSKVLQTINLGTKLTLVKGPLSANGQDWYLVDYKQQLGWVLEKYIDVTQGN